MAASRQAKFGFAPGGPASHDSSDPGQAVRRVPPTEICRTARRCMQTHSPIRPTLACPRAFEPTRNHVRASIRPQRVASHAASFVPRASLPAAAGAWANPRPARRRRRKDGSLAEPTLPDPTRILARRRGSIGAVRIALAWPGSRGARRPSRYKRVAAPSRGLSPASGPAAPEDCVLPLPPAPHRLSAAAPASGWRFSSWLATKRSAVE